MSRALPYSRVAGGGDLVASQPDNLVVLSNRLEWSIGFGANNDNNFLGTILTAGGLQGAAPVSLMTQAAAQALTGWSFPNLIAYRSWIEVMAFPGMAFNLPDAEAVQAAALEALRQEVVFQAGVPVGTAPLLPAGAEPIGEWIGLTAPLINWSFGVWSIAGNLGVPVPIVTSYNAVTLKCRVAAEIMLLKG